MKELEKSSRNRMGLTLTATGLGIIIIVHGLSGLGSIQGRQRPCCIAGKYEGTRQDTASVTCPEATTERYKMEILQGKECDAAIWGTVTGESHPAVTQNFTGTVVRSETRGCCDIKGKFSGETDVTEFQGTLCRKGNKWSGSGTYKTTRGSIVCTGTWTMSQT